MIEILYKDIFSIIFYYLESKDKANFRLVCKAFGFYFYQFVKKLQITLDKHPKILNENQTFVDFDFLNKFSNLESILIECHLSYNNNIKIISIPKDNKIKTLELFGSSILIPHVEYEKFQHVEKYKHNDGSINDFSCLKYFPKLNNFKFNILKEINQKDLDYFFNLKSFGEIFHEKIKVFSEFHLNIRFNSDDKDKFKRHLNLLYKDYFLEKKILKTTDKKQRMFYPIGYIMKNELINNHINEIKEIHVLTSNFLSYNLNLNDAKNLKSIIFSKKIFLLSFEKFSKNFFNTFAVETISKNLEKLVLPKIQLYDNQRFEEFFKLLIKFKNLKYLDISNLKIFPGQKFPLFFENFQKLETLKTRSFNFDENDSLKNLKNLKSLKIILKNDGCNCPIYFIKEDLLSLRKFSIEWNNYFNDFRHFSETFYLETKTLNFMKNLLKLKIKNFIVRKDNDNILNLPFLKSFYCLSFFELNQRDFLNFKYLIDLNINLVYKYDQSYDFAYLFKNNHLEKYLRNLIIKTQFSSKSFQDLRLKLATFENLKIKIFQKHLKR